MTRETLTKNHGATTRFHPFVYKAMIGLGAWMALSAWGFFASDHTGYFLAIVTGFVFMVIVLPFQLWRIRRHGHDPRLKSEEGRIALADWLSGDFDAWQERLKGWDALAGSLLPIAACALGMMVFAILFRLSGHG